MSDTVSQIDLYYTNILQRQPDTGGLNYFVSQASSGTPLAQIETEIIQSPESQADVVPVVELYQTLFGRVPDQGGLDYFVNELRGGMSLAQIATQMVTSPEGVADFGAGAPVDAATITTLYENALGRAPSPSEITYQESVGTLGAIAAEISQSAEAQARLYGPTVSFLTAAGNGTESYQGSLVPSGAAVYLSLEQTHYTGGVGGDTTFVAAPEVSSIGLLTNTIQSADVITGQGTGNVLQLQLVLDLNTILSGETVTPTLTGVQDVQFLNSPNTAGLGGGEADLAAGVGPVGGGFTLDLINSTGVNQADVINSSNGIFTVADASQLTTVTVQNSQGAVFDILANSTSGLAISTATISNSGASAFQDTELFLGGEASSKLTLNVSNSPDNTTNSGRSFVDVDISGYTPTQGVKDLTLNLTSSAGATADNPNQLDLDVYNGPALDSLTIAAAGAEALAVFEDAAAAAAVTVTGAGGSLDFTVGDAFSAVKTFDGSAYAGDLSVKIASGTALTSVATGSGNDTVDLTDELGNKSYSVNLGAGDDVLNLGNSQENLTKATATFDGGGGTNTLGLTDGSSLSNGDTFTNFQILEIGPKANDGVSGGHGTFDLSKLAGLTTVDITSTGNGEEGLSSPVVLDHAADNGLTIAMTAAADQNFTTGNSLAVNLSAGATSSHSLTIDLNAVGTSAGSGTGTVDMTSLTVDHVAGAAHYIPGSHSEDLVLNAHFSGPNFSSDDVSRIDTATFNDATSITVHATGGGSFEFGQLVGAQVTSWTATSDGGNVDIGGTWSDASLAKMDNSGVTGSASASVVLGTDHGTGAQSHAFTYLGASGVDTLSFTSANYHSSGSGSFQSNDFTGHGGNDVFNISDNGSDTFHYVSQFDANATAGPNASVVNFAAGNFETIDGFIGASSAGQHFDALDFTSLNLPRNGVEINPMGLTVNSDLNQLSFTAFQGNQFYDPTSKSFHTVPDGSSHPVGSIVYQADAKDVYVLTDANHDGTFEASQDLAVHLQNNNGLSATDVAQHILIG